MRPSRTDALPRTMAEVQVERLHSETLILPLGRSCPALAERAFSPLSWPVCTMRCEPDPHGHFEEEAGRLRGQGPSRLFGLAMPFQGFPPGTHFHQKVHIIWTYWSISKELPAGEPGRLGRVGPASAKCVTFSSPRRSRQVERGQLQAPHSRVRRGGRPCRLGRGRSGGRGGGPRWRCALMG